MDSARMQAEFPLRVIRRLECGVSDAQGESIVNSGVFMCVCMCPTHVFRGTFMNPPALPSPLYPGYH